jgi:hypothetical protein
MPKTTNIARVFKTAWFSKAAKKAGIHDKELCMAVRQAMQGLADDLGGGVFKKRLNDNMHRSIIFGESRALVGVRVCVCQERPRQH